MLKPRIRKLVMLLASSFPLLTYADTPGVTLQGSGGIYTSAWADGLIPLYRHDQSLVFSDVQFQGNSTDAGILSLGGGYRKQINESGIVGAYLFYDRERSANENYYNVISPGVEYMTPTWHYRFNYYAPIGTKTYLTNANWADQLGNDQYLHWSGHTGTDSWESQYESISYGADFNIGYRFQHDKRWGIDLTPYVFNQADANALMGANAQLNFYSNDHTTLFLGDGYDNVNHNRVFVGISLSLGGHNNDDTVSNLMMSPIYRNQDVNTTSNGLPVHQYNTFGPQETEYTDVYFVNNTAHYEEGYGSPYEGDGTYENPYNSVYAVSDIDNPNANIRIASTGTPYDLPPGEGYGAPASIELHDEQTMAGYTNDYKTLATGNDRPIIYAPSGIILDGNNSLTGLQIRGDNIDGSVGITINGNSLLDDMLVGTTENNYLIGVKVNDNASASIQNSSITAYYASDSAVSDVMGVKTDSNATLSINNSTINATAGGQGVLFGNAYGIYVDNSSVSTITNSTINSSVIQTTQAWGIFLNGSGDATYTNNIISVNALSGYGYGLWTEGYAHTLRLSDSIVETNGDDQAFGVILSNTMSGSNTFISNSSIQTNASGDMSLGVYNANSLGNLTLDHDTIDVNGGTSNAIGVYLPSSSGETTISNTNIEANSNGSNVEGIYNPNSSGDLTISSSIISASSTSADATVYGIENASSTGTISIDNSTINATGENQTGAASTYGIYSIYSHDMNISNSIINVNSSWTGGSNPNPNAAGVVLYDNQGNVTITNTTLNVTDTGSNSTAAGLWYHDSEEGNLSTSNVTYNINAETAYDVWGVR